MQSSLQKGLEDYIKWGRDHNLSLNVSKTKVNRPNRDAIHDPAPFNAGNSNISFVNKFCYLGCTIDRDMTMYHEYKALYRKVEHQIFMLGKLRYLVDKRSAVLVYKQAILPYPDYAGFILVGCNIGYKKELQILQNNPLRMCLRYRLADRVTVDRLHSEANLQSIEQRGTFQLLKLLYTTIAKMWLI